MNLFHKTLGDTNDTKRQTNIEKYRRKRRKKKRSRFRSRSRIKSKLSKTRKPPKKEKLFSEWKPKLDVIFNDKLLLDALIAHTTETYSVENILFLQCIQELKDSLCDIDELDSKIVSIYNLYISPSAEHQINVSSACHSNILSKRHLFQTFDDDQKRSMFDLCVKEITHLTVASVLPSFYSSQIYQSVAPNSQYYVENSTIRLRKNSVSVSVSVSVSMSSTYHQSRAFSYRMHSADDCALPAIQKLQFSTTKSCVDESQICCVVPPENDNKPKRRRSTIKSYKIRMTPILSNAHEPSFSPMTFSPSATMTPLTPLSSFSLLGNDCNSETDFGCIP